MKRIDLPAPIVFAWMALTVVLMAQGLRLASERQSAVEPHRPAVLRPGGEVEVRAGSGPILYLDETPGRLALYEVLPARNLLRWVQDSPDSGGALLVPLEGLGAGSYALAAAPGHSGAATQEMDLPEQSLPVRARFRLLPD